MTAVILWTALGVLARVLIPFVTAWLDNPDIKWDKQFLVPPIASVIISALTLPLVLNQMPAGIVSPFAAFAFGWASTDIVREVQKFLTPEKK